LIVKVDSKYNEEGICIKYCGARLKRKRKKGKKERKKMKKIE
jgi:hypothetical protein